MKYTNKFNLPAPVVKVITEDDYEPGEEADYTVTQLLKPPRQLLLEREHDDEIVVDVSEEIFKLFGKAVHNVLENAGIPERRFMTTILGKTISGKPDRLTKDGLVQDWKMTTIYRFKGGQMPFEVEAQLNFYAEILRQNGYRPTALEAVPAFRDWSKGKRRREEDCPPSAMVVYPAKMWSPEFCRKFMEQRVKLHEEARRRLPECTNEERWADGKPFAVMKKGRKSAVRLFDTMEAALELIKVKGDKLHYLEHRRIRSVRCEDGYCLAAPFCKQFQKIQKDAEENCDKCGEKKRPGKFGLYCHRCWREKQPY